MRPSAGGAPQRPAGTAWRRLWPLALIVAGFVAFFAFGGNTYLDFETLRSHHAQLADWVAAHRLQAALAYGLAYALVVAFSLPGGAVMTIAGGYLFGAVWATLYVVIAATIGATALFVAAKTALGDPLRARAGPFMRRMEAGFRANALSYLLVLRLIPLFPFWLVNLAPAFLGVPLKTYVIGTFFGIIPGTLVYAWVGSGLGSLLESGREPNLGIIFEPRFLAPLVALAALSLLPVVYRYWRARRGRAETQPVPPSHG